MEEGDLNPDQQRESAGELLIDAALAGDEDAMAAALARDRRGPARSLHIAAALADSNSALALLAADAALADQPGGRRSWRPLLYLCSSRRRGHQADEGRIRIASHLLELGAAVTGREAGFQSTHGTMLWEDNELMAIEAAAGRAASPALVKLLLDAGAQLEHTTVALLQAVRGGSIEVLSLLLAALPSSVSWQTGWALRESIVAGRNDMARMLAARAHLPAEQALLEGIRLGRGRDLLELLLGNETSGTAAHGILENAYRQAVRHGNATAADMLLRRGVSEGAATAIDRILGACLTGDRDALNRLLREHPYASDFLGNDDHRVLAWSIRSGMSQAVPLLLSAGLDPNVPDCDGETPLRLAMFAGASDAVNALVEAGADLDAGNFDGKKPLEDEPRSAGAAGREGQNRMFERAADAVVSGDAAKLRELLDEEPSLIQARSPRPHRATLLHYCGANGVEEERQRTPDNAVLILQLLLERGAEVNATCKLYRGGTTTMELVLTSIHPARAGLRLALGEVLLKGGATLESRKTAGLCEAAALGRLDLVKAYLRRSTPEGASSMPELMLAEMRSALKWAREFGRTEVTEYLTGKGAS